MKKYFFLILLFFCGSLIAQPKQDSVTKRPNTFWSLSINGGGIVPLGTFGNLYNNSASFGIEFAYHPFRKISFFFNPQYDFLSSKDVNYSGTAGYIEFGVGARLYLGKTSELFFIEAGPGDYFYYYTSTISNSSNTLIKGSFGIKAGLGANISLTNKILAFVKTDFHILFTPIDKTYYPGLYAGLRFIF
jgi:hypothetical protein